MPRRFARLALALLTAATLVAAGGLTVLALGGGDWAVNLVLRKINPWPGASLRAGDVMGNLLTAPRLYRLSLTRADGEVILRADSAAVRYDLRRLLGGDVTLAEIRVYGADLVLRQRDDGRWDLPARRTRPPGSPAKQPDVIRLERVQIVDASARLRLSIGGKPRLLAADSIGVDATGIRIDPEVTIERAAVGFRVRSGDLARRPVTVQAQGFLRPAAVTVRRLTLDSDSSAVTASGIVPLARRDGRGPDLRLSRLDLSARPLALRDLGGLLPMLDRPGSARIEAHARGGDDGAAVRLDTELSDGGRAAAEGVVTLFGQRPLRYRGRATVQAVDPGFLGLTPSRGDRITGDATLDLRGPRLDRLDGEARVDFTDSRFGPIAMTRARARGTFSAGQARIALSGRSPRMQLTIAGDVRPFDSLPTYGLEARVRPGAAAPGWARRLLGTGSAAIIQADGVGVSPRRANAVLAARVAPRPDGDGLLDSGSVRVRLRGGIARADGRLGVSGGTLTLDGDAVLDSVPRYRLSAQLRREDGLEARLSLTGSGTDPDSASVQAAISGSAAYGAHRLSGGGLQLALDRGLVRVSGGATVDGAELELRGSAKPFGPEPAVNLDHIRFDGLDLGRLASSSVPPSDLAGTGRLRASRAGGHWNGSGALGMAGRIGRATVDTANLVAMIRRDELTVDLDGTGPAGRVTLSALARPIDTPRRYALHNARFDALDLGRLLGSSSLETSVTGGLEVEAMAPEGGPMALDATVSLDSSTVNRTVIRNGVLRAKLAQGRWDLRGRLLGDADSLRLEASLEPQPDQPQVRLTAEAGAGDLGTLLRRPGLRAQGRTRVDFSGSWGSLETMRLGGTIAAAGEANGVAVDSLQATVRLEGGALLIDTLRARSSVGTAAARGRVGLVGAAIGGPLEGSLEARINDLAPLGPLLGVEPLGVDSGRVALAVEGTRTRPAVRAEVQAAELTHGSYRIRTLSATVAASLDSGYALARGTGRVRLEGLSSGKQGVSRMQLEGSYSDRRGALMGEADLDGHRHARVAARLTRDGHRGQVSLDTLELTAREDRWSLAHPVAVAYEGSSRLDVNDFVFASEKSRITANGTVDRGGEQRMRVALDTVPLGWITELLGLPELEGEATGGLELTGPAAAPRLAGTVGLDLRARREPLARGSVGVDWRPADGLGVELGIHQPRGDSLRIVARAPLILSLAADDSAAALVRRSPTGEVTLDATANDFHLDPFERLIDPATLTTLRGRLRLDAHARGSLSAPNLSGTVGLSDLRLKLTRLGATWEHGAVLASLKGRDIRVDTARMESGKGTVEVGGVARVSDSGSVALDLKGRFTDFRVADAENLRSTVSGNLALGGTASVPVVSGKLALRNTDFYLQVTNREHGGEEVELTPEDLRTLERRFGEAPRAARRLDEHPLALDLDVDLAGNDWVRRRTSPTVAVEVGGKLQVRKRSREPVLVYGTIRPLAGRSFVELLGRRFDVTEGEVVLAGPPEQARLQVLAEYRADSGSTAGGGSPSGVIITTQVAVDSGRLSVDLGSRPRMSDDDIRSYLATGRPAGTDPTATGDESNVLATTTSLAVGAALGTVAGGAGRRLGFDVVQILQDRQGGQTLVAGKYVSPPLYLGFRQPIVAREEPGQTQTARTTMEWEVEYDALRRALLNVQASGDEFRVFLRLRR
jgi:translocation and assembly module TamB